MSWAQVSQAPTQKLSLGSIPTVPFQLISVCKSLSSYLLAHCPLIHPTHHDAAASNWEKPAEL